MASQIRSPKTTRGARRRELTRQRLLEAGKLLIAKRGVAGLRIQEITEFADVALGSFYNHFATKEDLVAQVVSDSLSELADNIIGAIQDGVDTAEIVVVACVQVIQLAEDEPDFARLVVNLANADVLFGAAIQPSAREVVKRGIASGRFTVASLDVTLAAIIGGALTIIREMLDGRHPPGSEYYFARFVLGGLGLSHEEAARITESTIRRLRSEKESAAGLDPENQA